MAQDQDKGRPQASEDQEKLNPKVDSGDVEEFPKHRNAGEFGTHGGPNKSGKEDTRKIHAPGSSKAGSQ